MKIQSTLPMPGKIDPTELQARREEQLQQAAKMYEQHFMNELVKAMRQSVPEGGLLPTSMGEKIFREQLDQQYVENWSQRGGVGLADMIYDHVKERYLGGSSEAQTKVQPGPVALKKDGK